MEVALQDDGVFLYEEHYDRDLAYRQLRALGATHLRMNILWWQPIPAAQRTQTTRSVEHHLRLERLGRRDQPRARPSASRSSST